MKSVLAAICLALFCALPSLADESRSLVGVWRLGTYVVEFQDTDEKVAPFGAHPNGIAIFTNDGRTMGILTAEGRKVPRTEADRAAAFQGMVAYSGTYRLEEDRWITTVDIAWNEAWMGTEQIRFYHVEGEQLTVTSNWRPYPLYEGRVARGILTWSRVP